ncbi:hypothetical protein CMI39_01515 [Candidatus Pacearchaeota archaeon]|jgi:glycosyltransferase involved in cell wall biosynthesis|nr:hypothetical protein [Candidatus Pacearchaeota archaeon]|tara:strand:- start:11270 stop:12229 length:960 start_codon:yes stop_codon:yes gene_type:complete
MKFSLIIPLAPERGAEIIDSIKKLNYPKSDFHIIIVKGKNPSDNRNKGAMNAKGEIIGFLDDDAVVDVDLLKNVEEFFKEHQNIDIVGGPQLTPHDETGFAKISGYALSSKFGAWNLSQRYSRKKLNLNADEGSITSANLFVKKNVIDKIKFDSNLFPGEDPKFIDDAKKYGFNVAYSPDLIMYHRRRPNIKSLIKQIFNYGKVRPAKESFISTLKKPSFLIPSVFFIYLSILAISILVNPTITGGAIGIGKNTNYLSLNFLLFVPLFFYILLSLGFSIYDSIKNKAYKATLFLPFIYPMIHISYGAGMIYGYLKKLKK